MTCRMTPEDRESLIGLGESMGSGRARGTNGRAMMDNIKKWKELSRMDVESVLSALIDRRILTLQVAERKRAQGLYSIADDAMGNIKAISIAEQLLEELWEKER